jgi:hypothetical protein
MRADLVKTLPDEAFARGLKVLHHRRSVQGVLILGFDTEYDAETGEIICYQLSDGKCHVCQSVDCNSPKDPSHQCLNSSLLERTKDFTWKELAEWVQACMREWGYSLRDYSQLLLVSHFSTAELSHLENFWEDAVVRRVSAAQVYNASYRINQRQRLVVMDNYHFWNVGNSGNASLAAVAEKFGEMKLELPEDLPIDKTTRKYLDDPRFVKYAIWDAVACARVFHKFRERLWKDHEIDVVQYPTSASLAMAVYRKHFLPNDFKAPDPKIRRQAWRSLWGGRAEAYKQGDFHKPHTLRDVVSLYPNSEKLLWILPRAEDWIERTEPQAWRGLCRVKFEFPSGVEFPCLPMSHDQKLIFPSSGISDCTLDEAKLALQMGAKLEFISVWEYDEGDTSLSHFMEHFTKQKAEFDEVGYYQNSKWTLCDHVGDCQCEMKDAVGRELAKLMMNSLIGKFSQNRGDVDVEDMKAFAEKIKVPLKICMSPSFFHPDKPRASFRIGGHIMPEWSALILGKARAVMGALLNDVGSSLICSTDSMLVPDELNPLVDATMKKLGVVLTSKNKGKTTKRVRVIRNRVYAAVDDQEKIIFGASHAIHLGAKNRKCQSCKKDECKDVTHSAFKFILSEETTYKKTKRTGLKTAIREGSRFFGEKEVEMEFNRAWDQKRRLLPDGDSRPWASLDEYNLANGLKPSQAELET